MVFKLKFFILLLTAFISGNAIAGYTGEIDGDYGSSLKFLSSNPDGSLNAEFDCGDQFISLKPAAAAVNDEGGYRYYCILYSNGRNGWDPTLSPVWGEMSSVYPEAGVPVTDIPVRKFVLPKQYRYSYFTLVMQWGTENYPKFGRQEILHPGSPLPYPVCNVANQIDINYGNIESHSYDGSTKDATVNVSCTGLQADVTLGFTNSTISLSNGTTADLSFPQSNTSPTYAFELENSSNDVQIRSTLKGVDPAPGDFSGSTTMVLGIE